MKRGTVIALVGVGVAALSLVLIPRPSRLRGALRRVPRGLIVGDSMLASPVLTNELARLTGVPWDNLAVVGQDSRRTRITALAELGRGRYGVVVVSTGTNDGGTGNTMGNLEAIYDKAREAGTAVVLLSGPPWRCYRNVPAASWARHEAVRARAGRGVSDGYVDLYALWGDGEACIRREYDAGDRLHPNAAGRRLLARHIAGMLSR